MGTPLLHAGAVVICMHAGQAQPIVQNPRVKVGGMNTVTIASVGIVQTVAPDSATNTTAIAWQPPLQGTYDDSAPPQVVTFRKQAALFGYNAPAWESLPPAVQAQYCTTTPSPIYCVAFAHDGTQAVSGQADGSIIFWRVGQTIAHELAHIVQQRAGRVPRPQKAGDIVEHPRLEAEAHSAGDRAASGIRPALSMSSAIAATGGAQLSAPAQPWRPGNPWQWLRRQWAKFKQWRRQKRGSPQLNVQTGEQTPLRSEQGNEAAQYGTLNTLGPTTGIAGTIGTGAGFLNPPVGNPPAWLSTPASGFSTGTSLWTGLADTVGFIAEAWDMHKKGGWSRKRKAESW